MQFVNTASGLDAVVDHVDQVFCFGIIFFQRLDLEIAAFRRNMLHFRDLPVVAPVVIDSVKAVGFHDVEGTGQNEVTPVFTACPAVNIGIMHIHTAAV